MDWEVVAAMASGMPALAVMVEVADRRLRDRAQRNARRRLDRP